MEAFSDGVIAVIITIMVLELHVPHTDGWPAVREIAPRLGVYFLSFVMIGIYWLNHHELLRRVERVHYSTLLTNLLWLFISSLIPLSTEYVDEKQFSAFAVMQYAVMMLLTGASFGLLRMTLLRVQRQTGTFGENDRAEVAKHVGSLLLYVVAVPAAYWHPLFSLALTASVTVIWIAPWLGTQHVARMHAPLPRSSKGESR
ncbi:TMEM175 family protein [Terriglobus aquaticus]